MKLMNLIENKRYRLYVDMDGVLTDFVRAFRSISDDAGAKTPDRYEDKYGTVVFYNLIKKHGIDYWKNMNWMSDGKKLWSYVKYKNPTILSTPFTGFKPSYDGKIAWIGKNLGSIKYILSDKKEKYSTDNSVLIDDRQKNISRWISSGGKAILHKSAASTIAQLKEMGI